MSALSLFTDDILHVGSMKEVFVRGKRCSVKYIDHKKYAARVLAICNNDNVLIKLKDYIEAGAHEELEIDLMCIGLAEMTHLAVSKAIIKDTDNDFIFIDKAILPELNVGTCISALTLKWASEQEDFFDNPSQFVKLRVKNDSQDNINTTSSPLHRQDRNGKIPPSTREIHSNDASQVDLRTRWTPQQRQIIISTFKKYLEIDTFPSGAKMQNLIDSNPCFKGRTVPHLRSFLQNHKKKIFKVKAESIHSPKKRKRMEEETSPKPAIKIPLDSYVAEPSQPSTKRKKMEERMSTIPVEVKSHHSCAVNKRNSSRCDRNIEIIAIPGSMNLEPSPTPTNDKKDQKTETKHQADDEKPSLKPGIIEQPSSKCYKTDEENHGVPPPELKYPVPEKIKNFLLEKKVPEKTKGQIYDKSNGDNDFPKESQVKGQENDEKNPLAPEMTDLKTSTLPMMESQSSSASLETDKGNEPIPLPVSMYPATRDTINSIPVEMNSETSFLSTNNNNDEKSEITCRVNDKKLSLIAQVMVAQTPISRMTDLNISLPSITIPQSSSRFPKITENYDHVSPLSISPTKNNSEKSEASGRIDRGKRPSIPEITGLRTSIPPMIDPQSSSVSLKSGSNNEDFPLSESMDPATKEKTHPVPEEIDPETLFTPTNNTNCRKSETSGDNEDVPSSESIFRVSREKIASIPGESGPETSVNSANSVKCEVEHQNSDKTQLPMQGMTDSETSIPTMLEPQSSSASLRSGSNNEDFPLPESMDPATQEKIHPVPKEIDPETLFTPANNNNCRKSETSGDNEDVSSSESISRVSRDKIPSIPGESGPETLVNSANSVKCEVDHQNSDKTQLPMQKMTDLETSIPTMLESQSSPASLKNGSNNGDFPLPESMDPAPKEKTHLVPEEIDSEILFTPANNNNCWKSEAKLQVDDETPTFKMIDFEPASLTISTDNNAIYSPQSMHPILREKIMAFKTLPPATVHPEESSPADVVEEISDVDTLAKCQMSTEPAKSIHTILNNTYSIDKDGDNSLSFQTTYLEASEPQNLDGTKILYSSLKGNENTPPSQEKWLGNETEIIVTPSATPNVSINLERRKNIHEMDTHGVQEESSSVGNFSTTKNAVNSLNFNELLTNFDLKVPAKETMDDIDPFKHNIYPDVESSTHSSPDGIESDMDEQEKQSYEKPIPKITKIETVNFQLHKRLLGRVRPGRAKRRLSFENEESTYVFDASVDNQELEEPLLHSTMNESEAPCGIHDEDDDKTSVVDGRESDEESDDSREGDVNYKPDDEESSGSDEDSESRLVQEVIQEEGKRNKSRVAEPLNITLGDNPPASAPDDRELQVDQVSSVTKKHFCFYCKKFQAKLARHLELRHRLEDDVKKFVSLPPKNKERQAIIATIRKNGDYLYNTDRRYNDGKLIVCRRPNARMQKTAEDFLTCGNCRGQYARSVLRHHFRKCTGRINLRGRVVVVKGKKVSARVHERASTAVRKHIFPYMREDEVVRSIRYDELITLFANKQCQKYGTHQHLYKMIRARLRLLGRFFIAIKELDKGKRIKHFAEIYNPRYYDIAIDAVRVMAGYLPEEQIFQTPAVASNLGGLLKQVGEVLRSECIKREQAMEQGRVESFMKLMAEDYGISINRVVTETQTQNNRRKEVVLPSTDDIKKLYSLIKSERCKYQSQLNEGFSFEAWKNLGKMTLLSLQIFNRRRPGEIERLYLEDFRSYRGLDYTVEKEAYNALSEEGKKLARRYVRFEIRGKLGRGVPVLVDNDVLNCLNLLIEHREMAGVPPKNKYLFGQPSSDKDRNKYLRACNLMREYSEKCGAEIPSVLRGTQLRKHIATRCINLNLTEGQVTDLANFMGHHEKIHKDIYRQPVLETDIVKISKILKTAQGFDESDGSDNDDELNQTTSTMNSSRNDFDDQPSTSSRASGGNFKKPFIHTHLDTSTSKRWSEEEREIVLSTFQSHLAADKILSRAEMQALINSNSCLKRRTVPQMRSWLHT